MGNFRVGIFQVGVILGGNFLWWGFSGWEFSGGNHPGGSFPSTDFGVVNSTSLLVFSTFSFNLEFFTNCSIISFIVI